MADIVLANVYVTHMSYYYDYWILEIEIQAYIEEK